MKPIGNIAPLSSLFELAKSIMSDYIEDDRKDKDQQSENKEDDNNK